MQPLVEYQRKKMFGGMSLQEHNSEHQKKKRSASMRTIQRMEDKKMLQKSLLHTERLKRLVKIEDQEGLDHDVVLDGCAEDGSDINSTVLLCDIEDDCKNDNGKKDIKLITQSDTLSLKPQLNNFRSCYICKRRFSELHHFYHSLCELCAAHNWKKRMQTCDMTNRVCLVTGGRVKIGFQCCLKLLRCGATVICTSRFPMDTAKRYAIQKDFQSWKDRLFIVGLDLRDLAYLEHFCQGLYKSFQRLDVIINNACQTIRRPTGYYSHLLEDEKQFSHMAKSDQAVDMQILLENGNDGSDQYKICADINAQCNDDNTANNKIKLSLASSDLKEILSLEAALRKSFNHETRTTAQLKSGSEFSQSLLTDDTSTIGECSGSSREPTTISHLTSAEKSQIPLTAEDRVLDTSSCLLPANVRDVNNQQIDLRRRNSWILKTDEVETPEVAEVFAINSISPFVLVSKLKKLLILGKKDYAGDLAMEVPPVVMKERDVIQQRGKLSTLNEFLLKSMTGNEAKAGLGTKSATNIRGANLKGVFADNCSFIVNVSSMEGKFYRHKTVFHSHTNMAKAALNMLTRTASTDYQCSNIYMTAVDTGWINDENPLEKACRIAKSSDFTTPLDEVDAAARILDPIFSPIGMSQERETDNGLNLCSPPFGCFFKDYHVSEW